MYVFKHDLIRIAILMWNFENGFSGFKGCKKSAWWCWCQMFYWMFYNSKVSYF